jgi:hypothetical protein
MTVDDLEAQTAALADEEAALRDRLRALESEIHSVLRRDAHANADAITEREKEIRRIVLRLVGIERERIEIQIADSL